MSQRMQIRYYHEYSFILSLIIAALCGYSVVRGSTLLLLARLLSTLNFLKARPTRRQTPNTDHRKNWCSEDKFEAVSTNSNK